MSISITPSSFSSGVSTARAEASGWRISSVTLKPALLTHLTMFWALVTEPVMI